MKTAQNVDSTAANHSPVDELATRSATNERGPNLERALRTAPFRTRAYDLGTPHVRIDNVAEAIAYADGEAHK
jgi:hypothetical protein